MELLTFPSLHKRYGSHTVLEQQDLSFSPGTHVLVGENGSGKSTFLRILGGFSSFLGKGQILDDIDLAKEPTAVRRYVNYAEAEPQFPDHISGDYLVSMFIQLLGGSREQVKEIQTHLYLTDYLSQKIGTYSSGMKKKLSLLLAFIGSPRLILLDEPFNTLDPPSRKGLCRLISERSVAGSSCIIALHEALPLDDMKVEGFWKIQEKKIISISSESFAAYFT